MCWQSRIRMKPVTYLRKNPCCGYFLQGAVRVVAVIDIVLAVFALVMLASSIALVFPEWLQSAEDEPLRYYIRLVTWAVGIGTKTTSIGLSVFLFTAAKQRNFQKCNVWMILTAVLYVIILLPLCILHFFILHFKAPVMTSTLVACFGPYKLYSMFIVKSFMNEIKAYGGFNTALSGLTDAEVEEFEMGNPPEFDYKTALEKVQYQAFNKNFEIPFERLQIDECNPLGSGAFGMVFKGRVIDENGKTKQVAVKTLLPTADSEYFKTLLGELKIMTFLSPHENIVNLLGACTSRIREKTLYIVVELCPYGNLHEYLKARRGLFTSYVHKGDYVEGNQKNYTNLNKSSALTTEQLLRWSLETAKGMSFLSNQKVIHGDLAARNILLDAGKIAKITDFGLSKKLYQYTHCINKEEKLLPWRWMAIESLKDLNFSIKSDVWSFGIVLWEFFSLAEIPYPGFLWDEEFVRKLENGLRMSQPSSCPNTIFVMLQCWEPNSENRPDFTQLISYLETELERLQSFLATPQKDDNRTEAPEGTIDKIDEYTITTGVTQADTAEEPNHNT